MARREEIVPVSEVPDPIRCPECKGGNLELQGTLQRDAIEIWVNGQVASRVASEEANVTFEIDKITCTTCDVLFYVVEDSVFNLHRTNALLSHQLMQGPRADKVC